MPTLLSILGLGDLGELHTPEPRQDLALEPTKIRFGGRKPIAGVSRKLSATQTAPGRGRSHSWPCPTPTAPDVGDDSTRLAWPLHEPTELPVREAPARVQNYALAPAPVDANAATDSAISCALRIRRYPRRRARLGLAQMRYSAPSAKTALGRDHSMCR